MRKSALLASGFWLLTSLLSFASDLQVIVSPGLGGVARNEEWTFVRVDCVNNGESFDGSVVVEGFTHNESVLPESHEIPVSLPRGSKKEFFAYFPYDAQAAVWRVRVYSGTGRSRKIVHDDSVAAATGPSANARFSAITGDNLLLAYIADDDSRSIRLEIPQPKTLNRMVQIARTSFDELPDRWIGYDAADVVVIPTTLLQHAMNDRYRALLEWVGTGGHLIVVPRVDANGRFHADWAKTLGVQMGTTIPFAPQGPFVTRYGAAPANTLRAMFECEPDETLFTDERGPLLFRKRYGLGNISFVAVDLIGPTWRNSFTSTALWRDLLANELGRSRDVSVNRRINYGYNYHTQNIINGLRQIPALKPPSFAWLAAYLCLYLFVMVVLNYFILRRLDRKELSLFTFPAIAIVFGIGAYWSGYFIRGGTSVLHQVNMVELAAGQTRGVARSFIGLFSAVREPCILTFPREAFPQYFFFDYRNPGDPNRALPPMRVKESANIQASVPISVWTMRTFMSDESVQVADGIRGQIIISGSSGKMQMEGWVENRLPSAFMCRSILVGVNAYNPSIEIPANGKREFGPGTFTHTQGNFYLGGPPPDQAMSSVFQWWSTEKQRPGVAYVIGSIPSDALGTLGVQTSRATTRQQQTLVAIRVPLKVAAGQKTFDSDWWEPDIAQVESGQVSPINWQQRASFYVNNGSVVMGYRLIGHQPGTRLKHISIMVNSQIWAGGNQNYSVAVFRRDQNTWSNLILGKLAEFDAAQVFDESQGAIDIKLSTGQGGNLQFQQQLIQLKGETE